jgi:hypothetical protein
MEHDERPPFSTVPEFIWGPDLCPWAIAMDLAIYCAARSFTSGDPRSDRYARCWPSMAGIASRARCSVDTVQRSLDRWEEHGFLYRRRSRRAPAVITFVDDPHDFVATRDERGIEAAVAGNDDHLARLQHQHRGKAAARAGGGRRHHRTSALDSAPTRIQEASLDSAPVQDQGPVDETRIRVTERVAIVTPVGAYFSYLKGLKNTL